MMRVAVIDYGSGNLHSASKALVHCAGQLDLEAEILVTDRAEWVAAADRIVLPGVGAFADCRAGLFAVDGMVQALEAAVQGRGVPFLGICVGMQLMASRGLEDGIHEGLGWIAGDVVAVEVGDPCLKIPHMGWNELHICNAGHPLLQALPMPAFSYFVHSYHMKPQQSAAILAETSYGETITAIIGQDNKVGMQFHPEKSQAVGLALLRNFLTWTPV